MSFAADLLGEITVDAVTDFLGNKECPDPFARELSLASWLVLTQLLIRLRAKGLIDEDDVTAIREATNVASGEWASAKQKSVRKIGREATAQITKVLDILDTIRA